jgi:hypothetical protein
MAQPIFPRAENRPATALPGHPAISIQAPTLGGRDVVRFEYSRPDGWPAFALVSGG